jgi:hypothetical protein
MGFDYFKDKNGKKLNWKDITRDERYFCAELFFCIKNDVNAFVEWLKINFHWNEISLNARKLTSDELVLNWEVGFEVCFYRDFVINFGNGVNRSIRSTEFSSKRTFDLCLFSENRIIIIEAKAQQSFKNDQNKEFLNDKRNILKLLNKSTDNFEVTILALASSIYFKNLETYKRQLPEVFSGYFSWQEIYDSFRKEEVFSIANHVYKK